MYCPNCAAANNDDAKFCRGCGANLSLVPQALTGKLSDSSSGESHKRGKHAKGPRLDEGIIKLFMGAAFLLITLILAFSGMGRGWWFWMLIPTFGLLGKGIAELLTFKLNRGAPQPPIGPAVRASEIPQHNTGPIVPPPSVTEGTTRHLDATTDPYKR